MKQHRKLLLILAIVLSVAVAAGSTMAYLQDTDEDVNVMTLGSVYIDQIEKERVNDTDKQTQLQDYTHEKPLYPSVYEGTSIPYAPADEWVVADDNAWKVVEDNEGVVDKFVTVKNVGTSDAYVRTIFAFESTKNPATEGDYVHAVINDNVMFPDEMTAWTWLPETVLIDGSYYQIGYVTYLKPLAPGAETIPSLKQVYMDKDAGNEYVETFGDEYKILVVSQAVQTAGFETAQAALDTAFKPISADNHPWMGEEPWNNAPTEYVEKKDHWDGTADTSWYNETDAEFVLTTAEQLAGLAELVDGGNTFAGKTVKLGNDICLGCATGDCASKGDEPIPFDPIGSYRNDLAFKGTFDGQDNTIQNLNQNTWALNNGYYYGDLGLGLFAYVEDATIKNLTMDSASISGESALCGTVAATAYGDMVFENIKVTNSQVNDYQYYAGGIVGWASGDHQYINCVVDETTVVGSQWGDFGNANGGLIGGIGSSGTYHIKDCTVAPRIDATNDVVSAYQWYNYRNSGMLIGKVPVTIKSGEVTTVPVPENVTCENVTVIYGDWANYHYCEFAGTGYPYVRAEAGVSVEAYSNVRYGHPTDANGNTVVDDNHVHNEGEAHMKLVAFDQLFGGPADHRYCYYGIATHDGVTVVYNNK